MSIKKHHISANLFDKDSLIDGYINSSGNSASASNTKRTDYILVEAGKKYTLTTEIKIGLGHYFAFYNAEKSVIGNTVDLRNLTTITVTIPENGMFVRFSMQSGDITKTAMFNEGSTALPYEPYGDTWNTIPYYKKQTSTNIITTFPKQIVGDGQPITTYTIKGNMIQNGTPTSTIPIYPSECGDKTANLFDGTTSATNQRISIQNGATYPSNGYSVTQYIEIKPSTRYTHNQSYECYYALYDENKSFLYGSGIRSGGGTSGSYANAKYLRIDFSTSDISTFMVVEGTTPPSEFEPYGYKIPISCGSTTVTAYTSEPIRKISNYADSKTLTTETRVIKKLVLTGEEAWGRNSGNSVLYLAISDGRGDNTITSMCTEYPAIVNVSAYANMSDKSICIKTDGSAIWIRDTDISSTTDFKTHLSQQYAAGTPVTIWYVLATPTTETVSMPEIPTTGNIEELNINTTLKPSELDLTYHGWHEHNTMKRTNNLWDDGDISLSVGDGNVSKVFKTALVGEYTLSFKYTGSKTGEILVLMRDTSNVDHPFSFNNNNSSTIYSVTFNYGLKQILFYVGSNYVDSQSNSGTYSNIMINTGSTALPYEPYWTEG